MAKKLLIRMTAFATAMAMVVLGAGVALAADDVENDQDLARSGHQGSIDAGTRTRGTEFSTSVALTIEYDGTKKHVAAGSTVVLELDGARSSVGVSADNMSFTIPTPWAAGSSVRSSALVRYTPGATEPAGDRSVDAFFKCKTGCTDGATVPAVHSNDQTLNTQQAKVAINYVLGALPSQDTTNPTFNCDAAPTTWSGSDHSIACTAADNVALSSTSPASFNLSTTVAAGQETSNASTGTQQICDTANNCVTAGPITGLKVDKKAPSVSYTSASPAANLAGWNNTNVTATFTATDGGSGFASSSSTTTGNSVASSEGTAVTVGSPAFTDLVGNFAAAGAATSAPFQIDKTAPGNFQFSGNPQTHYFGQTPSTLPTCTADDALSLVTSAGCTVGAYATTVGSHTLSASATDNAGNPGTAQSAQYSVLAWTLSGFYSPVDMGGVTNTVKAGSTVPLKFEVFAGTTEFTDTSVIDSFRVGTVPCATLSGTPMDDIETYSAGGTSLRYDSTGGQFIQNWKVPTGSNTCWKVVLITDDSSTATAYFKTK